MTTTRRTAALVLAVVAGTAIAVGLLVGLMPASAVGVNCGSAFAPSADADVADYVDTLSGQSPRTGVLGGVGIACDDALSGRRTGAIVTLVAGVGLGIGASALYWSTMPKQDADVPTQ